MALQLQEQEKERFERKQQERVLAKERKKLERQLQEHATEVVGLPKATAGKIAYEFFTTCEVVTILLYQCVYLSFLYPLVPHS